MSNNNTVSVDDILSNDPKAALQAGKSHTDVHGYPEEHNLPASLDISRNGITMAYTFTEREREVKKGKGPPYWAVKLTADNYCEFIDHIGLDIVLGWLQAAHNQKCQELSEDKEIFSADRSRVDSDLLTERLTKLSGRGATLIKLKAEMDELMKEIVAINMVLVTGSDSEKAKASDRQKELQAAIVANITKQAELKSNSSR